MKRFLFLLSGLLLLSGCGPSLNPVEVPIGKGGSGEISSFSLLTPGDNLILGSVSTFEWEEAKGASTYTLEICSSDLFVSGTDTIDYYSRPNIVDHSFTLHADLAFKDTTYYWRVTAKNALHEKVSSSTFSFFYKAPEIDEVLFPMGTADDWQLHPIGSYADIGIDQSDFFGNGEDSLVIDFKTEDTKRGVSESDGWIVVTKSVEKSIYGTDALLFNLYYSGQDATVFLRLVDRDNEYWHCQVDISVNSKQSVILRFADFVQRTGDVTVANMKFDYERIKYMEIVFERTFGDGVLLLSGMKAIKFANYRDRFIEKLHFTDYNEEQILTENYAFEYEASENELAIHHYGNTDGGKEKINGWGFVKFYVNRYLFTGDSIKFSVRYEGSAGNNAVVRVYEEDKDRWGYKIPYASLTSEYQEVVVPYNAFAKGDLLGDGKRQFYFIINLQFGMEGQYGTGTLYFKDVEIVKKADYITENVRKVKEDGLIEDFDSYHFAADIFRIWKPSSVNKDEYMSVNPTLKLGAENPYCGQFEYKADMEPATYMLPIEAEDGFTSLSLWMKDATVKWNEPWAAPIEDYSPDTYLYFQTELGDIYSYKIPKLDRLWTSYEVPFSAFRIYSQSSITPSKPEEITSSKLTGIGISFQYFYYDPVSGKPRPTYANNNPVYLDNIYLGKALSEGKTTLERIIEMDGETATFDDFEGYSDDRGLACFWNHGTSNAYQKMSLSDEVSSQGGSHSMALQYKTQSASPSYYITPAIAENVAGRALRISLKSDIPATVYVNFYFTGAQYRATLAEIETSWTEYVIGLNHFLNISTNQNGLNLNDIKNITRFSLGIVYWEGGDYSLHHLYVDDIIIDRSVSSYSTNTRTALN